MLLLLVWISFFYKVLFLNQTFVLEDSSRFFYPFWKWGAGIWNRGVVPLWNPDAGFGTPYFADPQMVAWYLPARIFYFAFSPTWAFTLLILAHYLWALLGFWVFARNRGFSPWIILCGSLVFGFSFNAIALSWATSMLFAYSWIPWVFYGLDALGQLRKGAFLILTSALALQLAAGYPLFFYMTVLAMGMNRFLVHAASGWRKPWGRELAAGIAATLMAVVFNAAWLLPFEEFVPLSNLGKRTGFVESLSWSDLATWFNPFFKGHPLFSSPESPFSVTVYFAGLPSLVLFLWAILFRRTSRISLAFFLLLLALSLGTTTYLGELFKILVPVYGLVVRSGYWIPFVLWALAGLLMELEKDLNEIRGAPWFLISFLIYFSALILGVPWQLWSFWLSLLFLFAAGASTLFNWNWRRVFLAISLAFSIGPVIRSIQFTMDQSYYNRPPEVCSNISQHGRIYNAPSLEDHFHYVSGNGVADSYLKLKDALVSNWPLAFGFQETGISNSLFLKSYLDWYYAPYWGAGSPKLLDYLNERYVVGWIPCFDKRPAMSAGLAPLYDNPSAEPLWRSCRKAVLQGDWKGDFSDMYEKGFSFSDACFVADQSLVGTYHPRTVSETSISPNTKIVKAVGKGETILVSAEMAYPGWKASVGGKMARLTEVNHGFLGLFLEDGQEAATITFFPTSFRIGTFFSLIVFAFWAGMIFRHFGNFHA